MKINSKIIYYKALSLTPERIHELEDMLHTFCETIKYEANTFSDSEISFSDINELLSCENFHQYRIKELKVWGYDKYDRNIKIDFVYPPPWCLFFGYTETCKCSFTLNNTDEECLLRKKLNDFLKKATTQYWILGKTSFLGLFFLFFVILIISYSFGDNPENQTSSDNLALVYQLVFLAIVILLITFDRKVVRYVFPPVVYLWGEEIERNRRMEIIRSNLFWTIIIGTIVGLLVTVLSQLIFK